LSRHTRVVLLCSFYSWIWLRLWVASDRIYAYPVDAGKFVTYEALKDFWRGRKGGAKLSTLETPAVGGALAGEKLPYSRNVTRTVRSPLAYTAVSENS
jgi:hypothetical protein